MSLRVTLSAANYDAFPRNKEELIYALSDVSPFGLTHDVMDELKEILREFGISSTPKTFAELSKGTHFLYRDGSNLERHVLGIAWDVGYCMQVKRMEGASWQMCYGQSFKYVSSFGNNEVIPLV